MQKLKLRIFNSAVFRNFAISILHSAICNLSERKPVDLTFAHYRNRFCMFRTYYALAVGKVKPDGINMKVIELPDPPSKEQEEALLSGAVLSGSDPSVVGSTRIAPGRRWIQSEMTLLPPMDSGAPRCRSTRALAGDVLRDGVLRVRRLPLA